MKNIIELQNIKAAVKKMAISGKISFADNCLIEEHVLFMRNDLAGRSGIVQLIKAQDSKIDGVRNIDNAKLTSGEAFICVGVAFSTAKSAAKIVNEIAVSNLDYQRTINGGGVSQGFYNNEFSLKVGSKEKLKMTLRHAMPEDGVDKPVRSEFCAVTPFIIDENQTILPEINCFNASGDAATEGHVLEACLIGYRLSSN
jgi:hypothetical protein